MIKSLFTAMLFAMTAPALSTPNKPTIALPVIPTVQVEKTKVLKAPKVLELDSKRTIKIIGGIGGGILGQAEELIKLADKSTAPIYLLINSPGGSVRTGNVFIAAMEMAQARGITVKCVVPVYAASMAFSILLACSERYALEKSELLFHPVRINASRITITAPLALALFEDLNKIDLALQELLTQELGLDKDIMLKAYYDEKWWKAGELAAAAKVGWISIVKDIKGVDGIFQLEPKASKKSKTPKDNGGFDDDFIHTPTK